LGPAIARYPGEKITLRDHTHFNILGNRVIAIGIEENWESLLQ
jgi:hypothetical protein